MCVCVYFALPNLSIMFIGQLRILKSLMRVTYSTNKHSHTPIQWRPTHELYLFTLFFFKHTSREWHGVDDVNTQPPISHGNLMPQVCGVGWLADWLVSLCLAFGWLDGWGVCV